MYLYFIDYTKAFDSVGHNKLWKTLKEVGKLLKKWVYQIILPVSWETYMQVKKQQLEPCMEQLTGSGLRKEYNKAVYHHLVYLAYPLGTSWEMSGLIQAGIKIGRRNTDNLKSVDDATLMKVKRS